MLAPIILFAFNRPEHTKQTLVSLKNNLLAEQSVLYIFIDGIKANADSIQIQKNNAVKQIVREQNWCREVHIIESDINKGLSKSVLTGVTQILNQYSKVIVLEDDLVTDKWFLKYMNEALTVYENIQDVVCVTGYIYPVTKPLPQNFLLKGADCWGWGTWQRGWDILNTKGNVLLEQLENKKLTPDFDFDNSYPYTQMLKDQIEGKNNSWAILWYASAYLKDKYTLYPSHSLVQNIGIDGSGIHSGTTHKFDIVLQHKEIKVEKLPVIENRVAKQIISMYFKNLHHLPKQTFLTKIIAFFKNG